MKAGRALADPLQKRRKPWMGAQGIDGVMAARQFCFRQGGVDFVMANLMQQNDRPALAAAQLGRQVMQALFRIPRDRALTKRAKGQIVHARQRWCPAAAGQGAEDG